MADQYLFDNEGSEDESGRKKLETPGSGLQTLQVSFQSLHILEDVHKRENI